MLAVHLSRISKNKTDFILFIACFFVPLHPHFAQMVELVDTRDLKSLDHSGRTGSSPVPGTTQVELR